MAETFEERLKEGDGTLTLSEWESLLIDRDNANCIGKGISVEKVKEIYLVDFFKPRIKAKHFVGAIGFESPIGPIKLDDRESQLEQIIVKPKIDTADFIRMIAIAYNIKLPDLRPYTELEETNDLRIILAFIYVKIVEELLEKHLRRNYIIRVDRLQSKIKGKLLVNRYIRENVARGMPQISVCQFYELTPDTLLNRIIKAGLRISRGLISQSPYFSSFNSLSGEAAKYISLMSNVTDVRITNADFARIRIHSQNRYYEDALEIAKLLIRCRRFYHELGYVPVRGFFVNMHDLFEKFVAGLLKLGIGRDKVKHKGTSSKFDYYLAGKESKKPIKLEPDITIELNGERIIIDAKYKELFERDELESKTDEVIGTDDYYGEGEEIKIRSTDIYQLVAYMDSDQEDRKNISGGWLVYPRDGKGIRIIKIKGFGDKNIKVLGFGLSDIDWLIGNAIHLLEE